jgi:hypothetical protein
MKWRLLMAVVALAAGGWSAWWFVGSAAHDRALNGWLADRRAAGWQAEAAAITTVGFPNRFDTRIERVALADPGSGWAWEAPFLDILMMSWQPTAAILAFPPEQALAVPGARTTIASEGLRASVRFAAGRSLSLIRASAEGRDIALQGPDWRAGAVALQAHVQRAQPGTTPDHGYDVYVALEGLRPTEALRDRVDPAGALPDLAQAVRLDAKVAFDRPLDRFAVEDHPPQIRAMSITSFEAAWGQLALRANGRLQADAQGFAEGRLNVRAENWRQMLRAAVDAGALDRDLARLIEQGLGLIAALSGDGDAIEAPLSFSGGRMSVGPVPLGPAPRFATR